MAGWTGVYGYRHRLGRPQRPSAPLGVQSLPPAPAAFVSVISAAGRRHIDGGARISSTSASPLVRPRGAGAGGRQGGTPATPRQSPRFAYTRSPCRDRGSRARTQASVPGRDQPDARTRRAGPPARSRATVIARRRKGRTYHDHFARPPPGNRRRVPPGRPGRPGRGRIPAPGHRARHRRPGSRGARHTDRAVGRPVPGFHPAAEPVSPAGGQPGARAGAGGDDTRPPGPRACRGGRDVAMINPAVFVTTFLAAAVEIIAMVIIVVGVGTIRGWRPTLIGAASGLVILAALILALGMTLTLVPIGVLRLVVGSLLFVFGLQWLRKGIRRVAASGFRGMGARNATGDDIPGHGMDWTAWLLAFKGVLLEGLEVTIIVVTFGAAARAFPTAALAAAAALVVICGAGALARRAVERIPRSALQLVVGTLLSAFGTFWAVEGLGIAWPGADLAIIALASWYILAAAYISRLRRHARQLTPQDKLAHASAR